jgi:hypothetical protein
VKKKFKRSGWVGGRSGGEFGLGIFGFLLIFDFHMDSVPLFFTCYGSDDLSLFLLISYFFTNYLSSFLFLDMGTSLKRLISFFGVFLLGGGVK